MQAHEYAIGGHDRASIGRYIGIFAALIASAATSASVSLVSVLVGYGFPTWTHTLVMVPISAGLAYTVAHALFNRFVWRGMALFSNLPNIDGTWACTGETLDSEGMAQYSWTARITISQSWQKIRVRSATDKSASNSVSAALIPEPDGCWMLIYSYRNEPRAGVSELHSHIGYSELRFEKDLNRAEGDYFNAKGRSTFGHMTLSKIRELS